LIKNSNSNIWVADFETEANDFYLKYGYTKTWLTYIENLHTDKSMLTITINDLWLFIKDIGIKENKNQYVYFHNLAFDGTFLLYYFNRINQNVETTINQFKKIYEIKVYLNKTKYISFRCSLMIFMASVKNLPNSTKGEINYDIIRNYKSIADAKSEEIQYIKNDVRTVKYNLLRLEKEKIKLNGYFKTMASIAYKDLRDTTNEHLKKHNLAWYKLFPKLSIDIDDYARDAYLGGMTYLNSKYKNKLLEFDIASWDRVSSYPSVMMNEWLPAGKPFISNDKPKGDKLYLVRIRVADASVKHGYHPFIASTRQMRYINDIYPKKLEDRILTLSCIDFMMFNKYYTSNYQILDYMIFPRKVRGIFNAYILKTYGTKKSTKATIKKGDKTSEVYHDALFNNFWSKLKLNAPYGKFGTNPKMISVSPIFIDDKLEWVEEIKEEKVNKFYLPVAIFITAYGRLRLLEQIQVNRHRFVYCDTDSVHLVDIDTPKSLIPHIGNELNKWEFEGVSVKSKYLKPKRYLKYKKNKKGQLEISRTIGGLNKSEHHRINFENFKQGIVIKNGKKVSHNVLGGRIIKPLNFTFK